MLRAAPETLLTALDDEEYRFGSGFPDTDIHKYEQHDR